jgi:hypothetical protein
MLYYDWAIGFFAAGYLYTCCMLLCFVCTACHIELIATNFDVGKAGVVLLAWNSKEQIYFL